MPDAFAHQHFGDLVFKQLNNDLKYRIISGLDLYNIGLQGPDYLFFYKPYKKNEVPVQGSRLHRETGHEFWEISLETLKTTSADRDESLAYLAGVMCHYVLDSCCHSFVNQYETNTGVSHPDIEGEFDRFLLDSLGLDPYTTDLVQKFKPTRHYSEVIAPFTQSISPKLTYDALMGFRFYRNIFHCSNSVKRNILYSILKLAGIYEKYRGQIINEKPYDNCEESDQILYQLLHEQVSVSAELITVLFQCADTGKSEALINSERMDFTFDGLLSE